MLPLERRANPSFGVRVMKSADAPHYPSGEQPHASPTGDQTAANDGSMISLRSLLWGAALSCVGVLLVGLGSRLEPDHGGAFLIAVAAVCIFASFGFLASWIHLTAKASRTPSSAIRFLETVRRYLANDPLQDSRAD